MWHRRDHRGERLDPKRTRALLRREGLPLAIWSSGEVTWFKHSDDKQAAAEALSAGLDPHGDIHPTEWKSDDGRHMLMLEHHC